ncbi:hypothetical protein BCF58_3519, partial [Chryseobacterium defluvii]
MKKNTIILGAILASMLSFAQVGIRTQVPSASLHIEPSSISSPTGMDGILIPRVKAFPAPQAKG